MFAGVENAAASSGLAVARPKEEANTMETVRDFVEKIVEGLIGKVGDAPIDRLYDHPACKLKSMTRSQYSHSSASRLNSERTEQGIEEQI